jgi:hypothetical protein
LLEKRLHLIVGMMSQDQIRASGFGTGRLKKLPTGSPGGGLGSGSGVSSSSADKSTLIIRRQLLHPAGFPSTLQPPTMIEMQDRNLATGLCQDMP